MKVKIKHLEKINHKVIRYANVWEDADLLLKGLNVSSHHKVLSLASGGDNAFALLARNPKMVLAVDLNAPQLFLTELKREAIRILDRETYLAFVGFREMSSSQRNEIFKNIRENLSYEAVQFWNRKNVLIQEGIVYAGQFEKYLKLFAKNFFSCIHSQEFVQQLFIPKKKSDQEAFYKGRWDTWKWRLFFKIYFSTFVVSRPGRSSYFNNESKLKADQGILEKAKQHLSSEFVFDNWMLHYCFKGHFGEFLPFYAKAENYEIIKENIDRLIIEKGSFVDNGSKYGKFDRFNLSNIFESMSIDQFKDTASELADRSNSESRLAYWNLKVSRNLAEVNAHFHRRNREENREKDKGFFYNDFIIDEYVY